MNIVLTRVKFLNIRNGNSSFPMTFVKHWSRNFSLHTRYIRQTFKNHCFLKAFQSDYPSLEAAIGGVP